MTVISETILQKVPQETSKWKGNNTNTFDRDKKNGIL